MHIISSLSTERSQYTLMELYGMMRAGGLELIASFRA